MRTTKSHTASNINGILGNILATIAASTNSEEMLKQCQKDLAELIGCDFVTIKIYDREKQALHPFGMGYYDPKLFPEVHPALNEVALSVPAENSISGRTLTEGIQEDYNLQEDSKLPLRQRKYHWTQFVEQTGVEGILSVPIPGVRDKDCPTIAVINLYTRTKTRRFSDDDVDHVKRVASAIGQRISTMRDVDELHAYREAARIIEKSVLLRSTMDDLATYAREQTLTLSSDIFLLKESEVQAVPRNGAEKRLWLVGSTGILSREGEPLASYENVWYRYEEGITGWAAYYRQTVRVTNRQDLKQYDLGLYHDAKYLHPDIEKETEHVNLIVVPIIANERFYGIIRVIGQKSNLPVGGHSQTVLQIIAEQLGGRLSAHERAEDQERRVTRARHTLASVFQMGVAGNHRTETDFLQEALQCAMNAVGADSGAITFHVPEKKQLEFQVYLPEQYTAQALKTPILENSRTWPISLAFQKQETLNLPDISEQITQMESIHPGVHACLAVPITLQARRIGVIACYRFTVGEFDEESVQTLEGIAQYIASIVLNRLLKDNLQQEIRIRNEFLAVAAHQMASPIAAMESHCKILADSETMTEERWQKVRHIIANSCRLTANILYQFTAVGEVIDRSDFPIIKRSMRLSRMLIEAAALYQPSAWQKRMTIHVEREALDALPEILADPKTIRHVFTNLFDNAIKYSKKGTLITLSLHDRTPGFCSLCIHNIGIPISEVEQKRIFEREYRSDIARAFNPVGNGLGLPIAQAIIERHGGSISVTSSPAHDHKGYANVRFYVTVPL